MLYLPVVLRTVSLCIMFFNEKCCRTFFSRGHFRHYNNPFSLYFSLAVVAVIEYCMALWFVAAMVLVRYMSMVVVICDRFGIVSK